MKKKPKKADEFERLAQIIKPENNIHPIFQNIFDSIPAINATKSK
jgi:hypothetical protein